MDMQQPSQPQYDQFQMPPAPAPANDKSGMAIASLVLGIVSLCAAFVGCGWLFSIVSIVLGILSMKSSKKTMAIVGIVLSVLTLIITCISIIFTLMNPDLMNNIMRSLPQQ